MSNASDKRLSERVPFILKVDYPDAKGVLADFTENVSKAGFFVQTEQALAMGAEVRLRLSFPGLLDPLEVAGRVAWVRGEQAGGRGRGIGISVEAAEYRKRLEQLLAINEQKEAPATGFRVLIVEDNPHIIEMYSYVLKKLAANDLKGRVPLEVHFAPDGHHAFTQLKESTFNLVMTDLYMPVLDGFGLVEKIREDSVLQKIPIVAISAGGKDAQERALQVGVDIFLRKPVRFAEVLETVKQLLHLK